MRVARLATAIIAAAASAYGWGTFLSSFPCPAGSQFPNGLGYRNGRLYLATNTTNNPFVWQLKPNNGSVLASHPAPALSVMGCTAGVAGETVSYWVASSYTGYIYQVGYLSGSVVNSFPAPGPHPFGLAFRDQNTMYHTDYVERRLYVMHPVTGSIYSSAPLDFRPCDVAYDARGFLWIADGNERIVRQCDTAGSAVSSFSVAAYGYCSGIAYYNKAVWVGVTVPLHCVLKFEVDPAYAVEPSSIGKVKALFR